MEDNDVSYKLDKLSRLPSLYKIAMVTLLPVIFNQSRGLMSCFDLGLVITLLVIKDTLVISLRAMCRNLQLFARVRILQASVEFLGRDLR